MLKVETQKLTMLLHAFVGNYLNAFSNQLPEFSQPVQRFKPATSWCFFNLWTRLGPQNVSCGPKKSLTFNSVMNNITFIVHFKTGSFFLNNSKLPLCSSLKV